jgi:hypothetical protein
MLSIGCRRLLTVGCALVAAHTLTQVASPGSQRGRAPRQRPNILFAIADDWSYGHAGAYGARWVSTPAFDRVSREGVLFTHAYTPNAKCAPSRANILTGRQSWQLKEAANHICYFPPEFKTWPEALGDAGYFVGMTGKGWAPGVANDVQGRPRQMIGEPHDRRETQPPTSRISRNDYAANFQDFLRSAPADRPWCFWYGSMEPHRGYEYGSGVAKGGKHLGDLDRVPGLWPDNDAVRNDMLDYAYEVEHFDRHLGRMLDLLQSRGELDRTIVVVTSDNGMPFPAAKGQAYDYSNHLPLAVRWGEGIRSPGRVVNDFVSFVDFAPTVAEVAGLRWNDTGMQPTVGRSLTDVLLSEKAGRVNRARDHVLVGKERHDVGRPGDVGYPIRGIVKENLLYLMNYEPSRWPAGNPETGYLNCDGGPTKTAVLKARLIPGQKIYWKKAFGKRPDEEMYDVKSDPECLVDLSKRAEYRSIKNRLRRQLDRELMAQGDPRVLGRGRIFDEYAYADPKTRHFYERYMRGEPVRAEWVNDTDFEKDVIE